MCETGNPQDPRTLSLDPLAAIERSYPTAIDTSGLELSDMQGFTNQSRERGFIDGAGHDAVESVTDQRRI